MPCSPMKYISLLTKGVPFEENKYLPWERVRNKTVAILLYGNLGKMHFPDIKTAPERHLGSPGLQPQPGNSPAKWNTQDQAKASFIT